MMMFGHGGGWLAIIIGLLVLVMIIIGIIALAVWAVRRLSGNSGGSHLTQKSGNSAREIVQTRYARGEISREEYLMILSELDS